MGLLRCISSILLCSLFVEDIFSFSQQLVSPCPRVFQYEENPYEIDRWFGTVTVQSNHDLVGVWFRLILDNKSIQLANWFGPVETKDRMTYLIKNPDYLLKANTPLTIRFYVRYDPNGPIPKVAGFRLNAVTKCPEGAEVLEAAIPATNLLLTNQSEDVLFAGFSHSGSNPVQEQVPNTTLTFVSPERVESPEVIDSPITSHLPSNEPENDAISAGSSDSGSTSLQNQQPSANLKSGPPESVNFPQRTEVTETPNMSQLATSKSAKEALSVGSTGLNSFKDQQPSTNLKSVSPEGRPGSNSDCDNFYYYNIAELLKNQMAKPNILPNASCGTIIKVPKPVPTQNHSTVEGEFPWRAALYYAKGIDLSYICGAALISLQHLITVAHCVTRKKSQTTVNPDNLVVYLGKFNIRYWNSRHIQDRVVEKIIVHSKYNPESFENNVAVLKMIKAVDLTTYVRPIRLWEGPTQLEVVVNQVATVVGWGLDENGKLMNQLVKTHMPIVSQKTCVNSFPDSYSRLTGNTTFCAGFKNGTSVCVEESGAGLVLPRADSDRYHPVWLLRGLVSISGAQQNRSKCDPSRYVAFTDVAQYLDFVKNTVKM